MPYQVFYYMYFQSHPFRRSVVLYFESESDIAPSLPARFGGPTAYAAFEICHDCYLARQHRYDLDFRCEHSPRGDRTWDARYLFK